MSHTHAPGRAAVWALSNDLDDVKNWDDDDDEAVSVTLVGAASPTLVLTDHETGASDTSTSLTTQTTYYCTVERTADTTVECRIYSDLGRTTLVDTLSVSVTSGRTWRYLVACNSYNDNEADAISFDVENLRAGDETIDYYYNTSWQVVEERKDGSSDPLAQYVWDIRYIDAPVLRWRDDNLDGDFLDSNETLYYTQDANFNVTALVNPSGTVLERTMYDPYGKPTFYDADWANPSDSSDYANEVLFAGYRCDTETGLYHVRHRAHHPTLGRWMRRDPIGYVDGMSLYEYCSSMPSLASDPMGRSTWYNPLTWLGSDKEEECLKALAFKVNVLTSLATSLSHVAAKQGFDRGDQGRLARFEDSRPHALWFRVNRVSDTLRKGTASTLMLPLLSRPGAISRTNYANRLGDPDKCRGLGDLFETNIKEALRQNVQGYKPPARSEELSPAIEYRKSPRGSYSYGPRRIIGNLAGDISADVNRVLHLTDPERLGFPRDKASCKICCEILLEMAEKVIDREIARPSMY